MVEIHYHKTGEPAEMCKTSVTRYGALGKNKSQTRNSGIKTFIDVSFFMKQEEIIYGIQAKKRFQVKYRRLVVPHASRRAKSKTIARIERRTSILVVFLISILERFFKSKINKISDRNQYYHAYHVILQISRPEVNRHFAEIKTNRE